MIIILTRGVSTEEYKHSRRIYKGTCDIRSESQPFQTKSELIEHSKQETKFKESGAILVLPVFEIGMSRYSFNFSIFGSLS